MWTATDGGSARLARQTRRGIFGLILSALTVMSACAGGDSSATPGGAITTSNETSTDLSAPGDASPASASTEPPSGDDSVSPGAMAADVVIDTAASGTPIDPRIRGTNVPAWLGAETFGAEWFLDAIRDAGATTIRMPGGSWSNSYDWAACEVGDDGCYWPWAARPSDFVQLLDDSGLAGIWTISINDTAESAAAAVAFFNGDPTDARTIGVDRSGINWGTAGEWASLRVAGGHPEPAGIELWEIGNEVYGGRPDTGGDECAPFGWEDVWTCDGREYIAGDEEHDGYLAIRAAMQDIDPTIEVGAVGVGDPSGWSDWGNEVIDGAGEALDFYVVHQYGFDQSPSSDAAFETAQTMWPTIIDSVRGALPDEAMLAITEYNLVAFDAGDSEQAMTRAVNALFVAETLGQFALGGVDIANHWNLANGTAANGTDYGLVNADDGARAPQFYGFAVWGRTGSELLAVETDVPGVHVYPTRRPDGSLAIVLLNFGGQSVEFTMATTDDASMSGSTIHTYDADDPSATSLNDGGAIPLQSDDEGWQIELPAWSLSLMEVPSDG